MTIKDWITGMIRLRIVSIDPHALLNYISEKGIIIKKIKWIDDLTIELIVSKKALKTIRPIVEKYQCDITTEDQSGLWTYGRKILHRSFLAIGLLIFLFLSIYIQSHILFVEVSGNSVVTARDILDHAERCGLHFGVRRSQLRSEQIKNMLLEDIPQLQWVGINTSGCIASINVRERTITENISSYSVAPGSIVAAQNGVIKQITASKGTIVCQIGQQINKGEVLISGVNACGDILLLTRAEGEVFADTNHELTLKALYPTHRRMNFRGSDRNLSVIFGKKLIKLYKDSGILDSTCVKIRNRYNLHLPNGYILPFSFCLESVSYFDTSQPKSIDMDIKWLLKQGEAYLNQKMIAGKVISTNYDYFSQAPIYGCVVRYSCEEMIGQIKTEEFFYKNGKSG